MVSIAVKQDHAPVAPLESPEQARDPEDVTEVPLSFEEAAPGSQAFSPARMMQEVLGREFAGIEEDEPWSLRRTVAFIVLSCGAFWTCVYFAIAAVLG